MDNEIVSLLVAASAILLVVILFIRIAIKLRKYGRSLTTTMFASAYEFLNKDQREAVEEISEMNANKKLEAESFGKPIE